MKCVKVKNDDAKVKSDTNSSSSSSSTAATGAGGRRYGLPTGQRADPAAQDSQRHRWPERIKRKDTPCLPIRRATRLHGVTADWLPISLLPAALIFMSS